MALSNGSNAETHAVLKSYHWEPQPAPARLIHQRLNDCLDQSSFGKQLSRRMLTETGTRLLDWIDHFGLPERDVAIQELPRVGYTQSQTAQGETVWIHEEGMFPRIRQVPGRQRHLAIKVESVVDFLFAHQLVNCQIEGDPFSSLRKACVEHGKSIEFWIVERHGDSGFESHTCSKSSAADLALSVTRHSEAFHLRRRECGTDYEGFQEANRLVDAAISDLGRDRACDLFFAAERDYWLKRNRAGRVQLARQSSLGLGWANHDHHTYRSSRESFVDLIAFLEKLGFVCRERFYAGREAGWGAQVIEHPVTGVTIFADVDMSPEELSQDFSHQPLPPRDHLGTVGLWCALHGEAFLQAGMHHLECQFDFDETREQLRQAGIDTMPPFTDFSYLRQAFTRGEQWPVNPDRVERLRTKARITDEQARQFLASGALGSHLEILQRDDGYKGFNQTGINEIITATDPRNASKAI